MNFQFPKELFVNTPLDDITNVEHLDAYATWEDSEEDDVIAIYQLIDVCRLKKITKCQLVRESDHNILITEKIEKNEDSNPI